VCCLSLGVYKSRGVQVSGYTSIGVYKSRGVQVKWYTSLGVYSISVRENIYRNRLGERQSVSATIA